MVHPTRILLLDRGDSTRPTVSAALEHAGYVVDVCADLEQAQRRLKSEPPQLALIVDRLIQVADDRLLSGLIRCATQERVQVAIVATNAELTHGRADLLSLPVISVQDAQTPTLLAQMALLLGLQERELHCHSVRADLHRVLANTTDAVLVLDADHRVQYANPRSAEILDRRLDELIDCPFGVPLAGPGTTELTLFRPDQTSRQCLMHVAVTTWEGAPAQVVFLRDVSAQRDAEARIEQLNAMLQGLRRINQLIVSEDDRQRLIEQATTVLAERLQDYYIWIALLDQRQTIQQFAVSSTKDSDASLEHLLGAGILPTCAKRAVASDGPILIDNPKLQCRHCPLVHSHGDRLSIVQGIRFDATCYGVIAVSLPRLHAGDREVLALFDELAGDLGFGLHKIEVQERMEQARLELLESRRSMATLLANLPGMAYRCQNDTSWTMIFVSAGCEELTGYPSQALLQNRQLAFVDLIHPDDRERVWQDVQTAVRADQAFEVEYRIVKSNGELRWVFERGVAVTTAASLLLEGIINDTTDRKLMELALIEREQHFRRLHEQMPVPYQTLDPTGRLLAVNQIWLQLFGYHPAQIIDHDFAELLVEDDREGYQAELRQLVHLGFSHGLPLIVQCRSGEIREVILEARAAYDAQGQVNQIHCVLVDQTEQRATERALQESETLFRSVFDHAPVGIAVVDRDGCPTICNPALANMLGYRADELERMSFAQLTHPADIEKELAQYQRLRAGEIGHYQIDKRYVHKLGHWVWGNLTVSMMYDEFQHPAAAIAMVMDVSERYRDMERLRQAAAVFRSTSEGVIVTDPDTRIVAVNGAFTRITGYTEDEVLGQTPKVMNSGRHRPTFFAQMWQELNTTDQWQGEIWNRRKSGEIYPEWLAISAVRDDHNQLVNYVGVFSDITRIKAAQAQLEFQAHHDPLTGLPNRIMFYDRVSQAIQRARRLHHVVGLMFIDLDRFKDINDSLGHAIGDQMLIEVAKRLSEHMRREDSVSRHGGDEFTVLIEGLTDVNQLARIAIKILRRVEEPMSVEGHHLYINATIGISCFPADGDTPEILIRNADTAMYHAKASGRNNYAFYDARFTEQARDRVRIEVDLRRAIERNELVLHYQPQVDCQHLAVTGVEALVRWNHPELGRLAPDRFIPLAEETGLIIALGRWVLQTAVQQLQTWQAEGIELPRVAVNVAVAQLRQEGFVDEVTQVLAQTGLPAYRLELEITEGFLSREAEVAPRILEKLQALGVVVAIDDFGTGYSSLKRLKTLPVDRLKIDQAFVRGIPEEATDLALSKSMLMLGHSLGLTVVAEGVETELQHALLSNEGCDNAQGFLFSRPLAVEEFRGWWQQWQTRHPVATTVEPAGDQSTSGCCRDESGLDPGDTRACKSGE